MIELVLNPAGATNTIHEQLRESYPLWGGPEKTAWHLERTVDGRPPDLLTLRLDGRCVAGIVIHYRTLALPGAPPTLCGILGSTWVRPEHRGRGYYSRLGRTVDAIAASRRATWLIGFSNASNHSGETLVRQGGGELPAEYWLFEPVAQLETDTLAGNWVEQAPESASARALWPGPEPWSLELPHLLYRTWDSFSSQFLARPSPTRILQSEDGARAVIEEVEDTDRLLLLDPGSTPEGHALGGLVARSHRRGRGFFCFRAPGALELPGARPRPRRIACRFNVKPLAASERETCARWALHSGDRM